MKINKSYFCFRTSVFRSRKFYVALLLALIYVGGTNACKDDADNESPGFDPSLPATVTSFMPDSGYIRSDFVITGSNFGTDADAIKVLFSDYNREATVIGVNNTSIYCIAPSQPDGDNSVKVVRGTDTITVAGTFHYTVKQSVSTVVGVRGETWGDYIKDGTLSEARIGDIYGLVAVTNGDLLAFDRTNGTIRYVSVEANQTSTLQTGFWGGDFARTADYNVAYNIQAAQPHRVYRYQEKNLWEPEMVITSIADGSGNVVAGDINSCALDGSEEWLYFVSQAGIFGRLEIANPENVEIMRNDLNGLMNVNNGSAIYYSAYDDAFFVSSYNANAVYKVSKDGQNIELYIGGNGQGVVFGDRLESCQLLRPAGVFVDGYGDIYVVCIDGPVIVKCDRKSGWVSLAAGQVGYGNWVDGSRDGDPLGKAYFHLPYSISDDENGNLYIGECYAGGTIRKLAIE